MSEKCECGYGYGENETNIDNCDICGEDFCSKCMKKHEKICKEQKTNKKDLIEYVIDFYNENSLDDETEALVLEFLEKKLNFDIRRI